MGPFHFKKIKRGRPCLKISRSRYKKFYSVSLSLSASTSLQMAFIFSLVFSKLPLLLSALLAMKFPIAESYTSIFSFGDSLADTGNLLHLRANDPPNVGRFPYGRTYFHHPTGRFSDGRLIIDFIGISPFASILLLLIRYKVRLMCFFSFFFEQHK